MVNQCHTYVEVSPSGDGLHLIFLGSKPEGAAKSRKGLEEMYDHGRYFTVTGNVFEGHDQLASNPRVVERAYKLWIDPEYGNPAAQAMLPQGGGLAARTEVPRRVRQGRPSARRRGRRRVFFICFL